MNLIKLIRSLVSLVGVTAATIRSLVGVAAMAVRSLVVIRGSMAVTAIRLDLDGVSFDDVIDLLVTSGLRVVAGVDSVKISLGVVTVSALVLAVVVIVVVVIYAPVKVVVGGML